MAGIGLREAHIWLAPAVGGDIASLSAAERLCMNRLHFDADRARYAAAHSQLRKALSWCVPAVAPTEWQFTAARHGRPELAADYADTGLRFNLSHAGRFVACVVTVAADCGIDVETIGRAANVPLIARYVLAPSEMARLLCTPADRRTEVFFRFWTLKEAYVKATGDGLTAQVDKCAFSLPPGPITVSHDRARRWQFHQRRLDGDHLLAIALSPRAPDPMSIIEHGPLS